MYRLVVSGKAPSSNTITVQEVPYRRGLAYKLIGKVIKNFRPKIESKELGEFVFENDPYDLKKLSLKIQNTAPDFSQMDLFRPVIQAWSTVVPGGTSISLDPSSILHVFDGSNI